MKQTQNALVPGCHTCRIPCKCRLGVPAWDLGMGPAKPSALPDFCIFEAAMVCVPLGQGLPWDTFADGYLVCPSSPPVPGSRDHSDYLGKLLGLKYSQMTSQCHGVLVVSESEGTGHRLRAWGCEDGACSPQPTLLITGTHGVLWLFLSSSEGLWPLLLAWEKPRL